MEFFFIDGKIPVVVEKVSTESCREPKGILILLHGLMYKDSEKFVEIAKRASEAGWIAIRFDQAGSGESKALATKNLIWSRLRDLSMVIEWALLRFPNLPLQASQERHSSPMGLYLWGSSFGGYLAYVYSLLKDVGQPERDYPPMKDLLPFSKHSHLVRAVISWATPFDVSMVKDFLLSGRSFVHSFDREDPVGYPQSLSFFKKAKIKNLIVHGIKDEIVPWSDALRIYELTGGSMVLFDKAGHRFLNPQEREMAIRVSLDWLNGLRDG